PPHLDRAIEHEQEAHAKHDCEYQRLHRGRACSGPRCERQPVGCCRTRESDAVRPGTIGAPATLSRRGALMILRRREPGPFISASIREKQLSACLTKTDPSAGLE